MRVALILAKATNDVIGHEGDIPWHLPDDMKFFKRKTLGKPVIMGRKTYDSIGKPLSGRQNIVLSKDTDFSPPGVIVVSDLDSALWAAADVEEVMVIGGAQVYRMALPLADRIYLTEVQAYIEGDTRFSLEIDQSFQEICREDHEKDAKHPYPFSFVVLDRKH